MPNPLDEDLIATKSLIAGVGAVAVLGVILLANADTQSMFGAMKGAAGIIFCASAIIGIIMLYKKLL